MASCWRMRRRTERLAGRSGGLPAGSACRIVLRFGAAAAMLADGCEEVQPENAGVAEVAEAVAMRPPGTSATATPMGRASITARGRAVPA